MTQKKPKRENNNDSDNLFFTTFIGEEVRIYLKGETVFGENGGVVSVGTVGILLDIDEDYYYLSDDGNKVNRAVLRTEVKIVELSEEEEPEIFKGMEVPSLPEEGN